MGGLLKQGVDTEWQTHVDIWDQAEYFHLIVIPKVALVGTTA